MNNKNEIAIALSSHASFIIVEGDEKEILGIIEDYADSKNAELTYVEGNQMNADASREFVSDLNKLDRNYSITVILDFEKVGVVPQNILLKSLENIGDKRKIVAICKNQFGLLDTVKSRAYNLYYSFKKLEEEIIRPIFLDSSHSKFERLISYTKEFDENLYYDYSLDNMASVQLIEKIAINEKVSQYQLRLDARCNKDLCTDLLIYKILED